MGSLPGTAGGNYFGWERHEFVGHGNVGAMVDLGWEVDGFSAVGLVRCVSR